VVSCLDKIFLWVSNKKNLTMLLAKSFGSFVCWSPVLSLNFFNFASISSIPENNTSTWQTKLPACSIPFKYKLSEI